ncbi:MAG TPA: carboxypeptidase regulatory-like domain-containing protein [Solirubrobacterales bacterium]|nr:carboxypeptidase regulatory-like domain-containing protein [Solirubrobacterales bacterium]
MPTLRFIVVTTAVALSTILAPSAFASGSIAGTATASDGSGAIVGLSVCAEENYVGGVHSSCSTTDAGGHYTIGGLPAGANYQVEFSAVGELNFLTQYWHGKEGLDNWDPVTVTDGVTTEGIDASVKPGASISGSVSEETSGAALAQIRVCVLDPAPTPRAEEFERCATTDEAGNYTVRSLPGGTYVVAFSHYSPLNPPSPFGQEYYRGASSEASATPITLMPPEARTGIDASLVNRLQTTLQLTRGTRIVTRHRQARVSFRFFAREAGVRFTCKSDRQNWRSCRSPQRFAVPAGRHVFRVKALGRTGEVGPPAVSHFRVVRHTGT